MMRLILALVVAGAFLIDPPGAQAEPKTTISHALSLIGKPKYDADFSHLERRSEQGIDPTPPIAHRRFGPSVGRGCPDSSPGDGPSESSRKR